MYEEKNVFSVDMKNGYSLKESMIIGSNYRITILSDVLIRFEYSEDRKFNDNLTLFALNRKFQKPEFSVSEDNYYLVITGKYFKIEYIKGKNFKSSNKLMPDTGLRVSLNNTDKVWYFGHPEIRNFKGCGYSYDNSQIDLKKGLYSTDGFVSFDDSTTPILDRDGNILKNPLSPGSIDTYLFIYRKDFNLALKSYYELTGMPSFIPRFSLGVWWQKNEDYSLNDVRKLITDFKDNKIPVSTILLNSSWHKKTNENNSTGFTFNDKLLGNKDEFIKYIHDNSMFLGLNIDTTGGIDPSEEVYMNFQKDINQNSNTLVPLNVYDRNIINAFLKNIVNPYINSGIDLFWIDENNNKDLMKLFILNYYIFNNYKTTPKRRGVLFSRNPGICSHRYPILYSGQTRVDWKTLKNLPYLNVTSSNMGVSWWSHDIGGYKGGMEDAELYTRYVQLGVYSPIFRFSSDKSKYYKREPWKWDVKTLGIVKDYTRLRHKLIPYIYTEAYKHSKVGDQLIEPIYYKYPEIIDEPLYRNEYYFGSELFVSPITDPKDRVMNRVVHKVFIPDGMWYDFKTGKKFPGGKRYVTFYKDEDYPVYAKGGSIIIMDALDENNLNNTRPPKKLEVQVFPGRSNSYNLYEDDGISSLYEEGYFIITNFDYNYRENNYTLIIRPVEGKSGIIPAKRDYKIKFRNTKYAEEVEVFVDQYKIPFKKYSEGPDFILEFENISTTSQITINCKGKDIEIAAVRIINDEIDNIISDLQIKTDLKEEISKIIFSDMEIKKKRIEIKRLRAKGLGSIFIRMFIKLLEYIAEI